MESEQLIFEKMFDFLNGSKKLSEISFSEICNNVLYCMGNALILASDNLKSLFEHDFKLNNLNLSYSQFRTISLIDLSEPLPLSELAKFTGRDKTTMSRNISKLVEMNFVKINRIGAKKQKILSLTDQGKEIYSKLYSIWNKTHNGLINSIGEARWIAILMDLSYLNKIIKELHIKD